MRLAAPTRNVLRISHAEEVMGTVVSFDLRVASSVAPDGPADALAAACAELHRADETFSTWKPGSVMCRVRRGELAVTAAPPEVAEVLALCHVGKTLSRGWFDPWAMPGGVDPTGLVKGWAAELALGRLRVDGVDAALVNAGGDLIAFGRPSPGETWRVGIRHPWRPDALAAVVDVRAAVATSGVYERGEHLFDPKSGAPSARAASATVTGPSLAIADALATALAVGGDEVLDALEGLDGYDGYLVRKDGSERWTEHMGFAAAA